MLSRSRSPRGHLLLTIPHARPGGAPRGNRSSASVDESRSAVQTPSARLFSLAHDKGYSMRFDLVESGRDETSRGFLHDVQQRNDYPPEELLYVLSWLVWKFPAGRHLGPAADRNIPGVRKARGKQSSHRSIVNAALPGSQPPWKSSYSSDTDPVARDRTSKLVMAPL